MGCNPRLDVTERRRLNPEQPVLLVDALAHVGREPEGQRVVGVVEQEAFLVVEIQDLGREGVVDDAARSARRGPALARRPARAP